MTPRRSPTTSPARKRSSEATPSAVLRLSRIALEFARSRDLPSALTGILNVAVEGYGCRKGWIYLHSSGGAKPWIAAHTGIDEAEAACLCGQPDPVQAVHSIPLVDESGENVGAIALVLETASSPNGQQTSLGQICAEHAANILQTAGQTMLPALSDSDRHLTTLLEVMPAAVYACDAEGRITFYNRRARELWGRAPKLGDLDERFCGSYRLKRVDGSVLPHHETPMAIVIAGGPEVHNEEVVLVRPDQSQVTVVVNIKALHDAGGRRTGAINVFQDVTDLRLAQEALARSQREERSRSQELEALMHAVPAAIMIAHDAAGTRITGNSVAYSMLRVEPGVNLSKSAPEGAAPNTFEVYQDGRPLTPEELPMQVAGRTGQPVLNTELEWRFPDGVSTWVYGGAIPLIDDEGAIRSVVGTFVDITELKLADQAVRESEERFRNMADCAPVMIRVMTPDARCSYANRLWFEFTGQDLFGALEHGWLSAVHPDDRAAALAGFSRAASSREVFRLEYRVRRADGAWRWVLSAGAPRLSRSGELLGFISSVIDISERKEMEDAIRSANADLQQFAYAAAHDLQEPLRNVTIYSQLLADRYGRHLQGEALQFLNFATHGARRMQTLVDDLLTYTRLSSTETDPAQVDTGKVLRQVTEDLESAIQESGARIEIGAMPVVKAHAGRLSQLFQNLISNAIKYRHPDVAPQVGIGAQEDGDGHWHFTVQDNGIGIEPDYHEQVFGIFKRLHHSSVPGTGIGLAICRRIVEGYRGRIWLESDGPMKGTTVHFTLPS